VLSNPFEDLEHAEFMPFHGTGDKSVPVCTVYFEIKSVDSQENVGGGKGDALIAVHKTVIVTERFHQRCGFLLDAAVVANLRTKNGSLHSAFIADTVKTAEPVDECMLHTVDFGYRKEV